MLSNEVGFRSVNGVNRGGSYYSTNRVLNVRCGMRNSSSRVIGWENAGFRLNGVMRGGRFSREASYILSGYRNGINKRTSAFVDVGFRLGCEWCITRWVL